MNVGISTQGASAADVIFDDVMLLPGIKQNATFAMYHNNSPCEDLIRKV
jgi:hypothetical protein